jgi:hypothetical protein
MIGNRHIPRLCRVCGAPMARQEEACGRCGVVWDAQPGRAPRLTVIVGGALGTSVNARIGTRAEREARLAQDRWANEGGSFDAEPIAPLRRAVGRV